MKQKLYSLLAIGAMLAGSLSAYAADQVPADNTPEAKLSLDNMKVTVTVTIPTVDQEGLPLPSIDKTELYIGSSKQVLKTWENPELGAQYTYEMDVEMGGYYIFSCCHFLGNYHSYDYQTHVEASFTLGYITDMQVTSTKGNAPVNVSFKLPTQDAFLYGAQELPDGLTFPTIEVFRTCWELGQENILVGTINGNYKKGDLVEWQDMGLADGDIPAIESGNYYYYTVKATGEFRDETKSVSDSRSIYLGADTPSYLPKCDLKFTNDGTTVNAALAWEAPQGGMNGGYVDPEEVKYLVYRTMDYGEEELLTEMPGLTETSYSDSFPMPESPINVMYRVVPYNEMTNLSSTWIGTTLSDMVGPSYTLPFYEGFNVGQYGGTSNIWKSSGWWANCNFSMITNWTTYDCTYYWPAGVSPVTTTTWEHPNIQADEDGNYPGLYSAMASKYQDNVAESWPLDLTESQNPIATFQVMRFSAENDMKLVFGVRAGDAEEMTPLQEIELRGPRDAWMQVEVPLSQFHGQKDVRLVFALPMCNADMYAAIDEISVVEGPSLGFEAPANVAASAAPGKVNVSWEAPATVPEGYTLEGYDVKVNGIKANDEPIAATSYTYYNAEAGELSIVVEALYSANYRMAADAVTVNAIAPDFTAPANLAASGDSEALTLSWEKAVAPEGFSVEGYNVFMDGNKQNEALITELSYVLNNVAAGQHTFAVEAAFSGGHSAMSEELFYDVAGVASLIAEGTVTVENGIIVINSLEYAAVVSLDGKVIYRGEGNARVAVAKGAYIVKVGNAATTIFVK